MVSKHQAQREKRPPLLQAKPVMEKQGTNLVPALRALFFFSCVSLDQVSQSFKNLGRVSVLYNQRAQ